MSDYCGVPYDGLWMNWYRDHRDSTSWHADRPASLQQTAIVPVLSLGATRRFLIRPNSGGPSTTFIPVGGDVLIMRGRCQARLAAQRPEATDTRGRPDECELQ